MIDSSSEDDGYSTPRSRSSRSGSQHEDEEYFSANEEEDESIFFDANDGYVCSVTLWSCLPGIVQYTSTTEWEDYVKSIENEHQCTIRDFMVARNTSHSANSTPQTSMSLLQALECKYGKITVQVIEGDITTVDADAIVNGCGENFNLKWGVLSTSILQKNGLQMQEECSKALSMDHPFVRVTSGGTLPCQHVLHIVTPKTVDELGVMVDEVLKVADSMKLISVAIPTLGTGGIGLSVDDMASIMQKAFLQFAAESPKNLRLIKVVVYEPSILSICRRIIITPQILSTFGFQKLQDVKVKVASLPLTVGLQIISNRRLLCKKIKTKLKKHFSEVSITKTILDVIFKEFSDSEWYDIYEEAATQSVSVNISRSCITLRGLQRSLSKVCDVIKCIAFDLCKGKSLQKSCIWQLSPVGDTFQPLPLRMSKDIELQYQNDNRGCVNVKLFGEIATIHLSEMKLNYKDIRASIQRICNGIEDLCSVTLWSYLPGIVQYTSSTEWQGCVKSIEDEQQCTIRDLMVQRNTVRVSDPSSLASMSLLQAFECKYGGFTVQVIEGDITTVDADAIVNGCGENFNLKWGVLSTSILQKNGLQMQEECSKALSMDHPFVRVTSGGTLPCQHVLHIVTPKTVDELGVMVDEVLKVADSMKLISVAIPTLGTGGIGLSVDDMASIMQKAFLQFAAESPKHLRLIKVVVYEPSILSICRRIIITPQILCTFGFQKLQDVKVKVATLPLTIGLQIISNRRLLCKKIKTIWIRHFSEVSITKTILDVIFKEFSDSEWYDIYEEAATQFVSVNISRSCITLRGLQRPVSKVCDVIKCVASDLRKGKALRKSCIWQWSPVGDTFQPLPLRMSNDIELQYQKDNRSCANVKLFGEIATIHLSEMKLNYKDIRAGIQRICNGIASTQTTFLPKFWDDMKGEAVRKIDLSPSSEEFQKVSHLFKRSNPQRSSIVTITRIQNPALYKQYMTKKADVECHVTGANPVERELFHGTSQSDAEKIIAQGFDRGFAGKNATKYGRGVYFAVRSSYSVNYATANPTGTFVMFLTKVITGDYCVGKGELKAAPVKLDAKNKHLLYDSVVDRLQNPVMFVVFKDSSAYPSYLITYK